LSVPSLRKDASILVVPLMKQQGHLRDKKMNKTK